MKTLDEVIESITTQSGLEIRNVRKPERDRFWVDRDTYNDALHYLREYQTLQYGYIKAMADIEDNPPLTWDELKAMRGKPIWIELLGNDHWKGWDVIAGFDEDDFGIAMVTVHNDDYYKLDLCKTWQAYRKERE